MKAASIHSTFFMAKRNYINIVQKTIMMISIYDYC